MNPMNNYYHYYFVALLGLRALQHNNLFLIKYILCISILLSTFVSVKMVA